MSSKIKILIVDDEEKFRNPLAQRLRLRDFDVAAFASGQEAVEAARKEEFELAIVDLKMPGMTGEQVLEALKKERPLTEVIILTGHGSIPSAVHCTQVGSYDYIQKPCETEELLYALKNAYQRRVQKALAIDREKMEELLGVTSGESPLGTLRRLKEMIQEGDALRK